MRTLVALLIAATLATPALAEDVQVKTPLGQTITGHKIASPPAGSVEGTIIASIDLITAGKFDEWMKDYCHPSYCPDDAAAREAMKNYNLTASSKTAAACLQDDGKSVIVTRQDGDPTKDSKVTTYLFCGEKRMPTPATLEKVGDAWRVSSFSW